MPNSIGLNCRYSTDSSVHRWKERSTEPSIDKDRPIGPYCTNCMQTKDEVERYIHFQLHVNKKMCELPRFAEVEHTYYNSDAFTLARLDLIYLLSESDTDIYLQIVLLYAREKQCCESDYEYLGKIIINLIEKCSDEFLIVNYENIFIWYWQICDKIQPSWLATIHKRGITLKLSEKIENSRWINPDFTKKRVSQLNGEGTADAQGCRH